MKQVTISVVITLLFVGITSLAWGQTTFHLHNDDTVTGELISFDGETYRIRSKYGILSVEPKDVASIEFNIAEGVVDIEVGEPTKNKRDRIQGTIESFQNGTLRIKTSYGYVVIDKPEKIGNVK